MKHLLKKIFSMLNNKINIPRSSLPMRKIYFKMKSSCIEKRLSSIPGKSQIKNYITATWLLCYTKSLGFYPSSFVCSRFAPKIQFLYCLVSSVAPWSGSAYAFQSITTLYSCLNVKKLLARKRCNICLSHCNGTRTHNHLVRKQKMC